MSADMVLFFKALADSSRLKIVGLLARHPYTVEELSALLGLKPSTVSHHLSKLSEVGLVTARAESYYSIYELDRQALETASRSLFSGEQLAATVADLDTDAYDRKVLLDYLLPDGRLKIIPSQRRKLEVVLRHIIKAFEPGMRYSEKQVNEVLTRFHADAASLRRELVGYGLLARQGDGREYWIP